MRQNSACYKDMLFESMPSEKVLDTVFVSDDVCKRITPEYLTSKDAFSISGQSVATLNQEVAVYGKGQKDSSLDSMYSYETGLTYSANKERKEAMAASVRPQKSVMASLKQIDAAAKVKQTASLKSLKRSTQH